MNSNDNTQEMNSIWDDEPGLSEKGVAKSDGAPGSVLILDDSKAHRLVLENLFLKWGYRVFGAANGLEGIDRLDREKWFDLILADWKMPFMDGIEFIRRVRIRPSCEKLPIIMMSGLNTAHHVSQGLRVGADEYLMKPFTAKDLAAKLEAMGLERIAELA